MALHSEPPSLLKWQLSHSAFTAQEHQPVHPLLSPLEPSHRHWCRRFQPPPSKLSLSPSFKSLLLSFHKPIWPSHSKSTDPLSLDLTLENHRSTRSWLHLFFVWGLVYYGNWVVLLVNLCHFIFLDLWIIEHDDWGFGLWLCFVTTCHLGLRKLIHFLHKVGELR